MCPLEPEAEGRLALFVLLLGPEGYLAFMRSKFEDEDNFLQKAYWNKKMIQL